MNIIYQKGDSMTQYTVPQLRQALAFAKEHPAGTIKVVDTGGWPRTYAGNEYRAWFRDCLMHKINRTLPASRGRKDNRTWFMEQWRASRDLNTPRLIIDWLPADLARRFATRLRHHSDR